MSDENWEARLAHLQGKIKSLHDQLEWSIKNEQQYKAELNKLNDSYKKIKAELWVAKDSQLRTYDGLAQKADTVDKLIPILEEVLNYLDWLKLDTANDLHIRTVAKLRELGFVDKETKI